MVVGYQAFLFSLGSRSALVNLEARPFSSNNLARRCAVAKLSEVTIDMLKSKINDGLSALLVLLPSKYPDIPEDDRIVSIKVDIQGFHNLKLTRDQI